MSSQRAQVDHNNAKPILLAVDDEPSARKYVAEKVPWETLGIARVEQAINGNDALSKIRILHPVLIVLDIKMPGMDGTSLLDVLTKQVDYPLSVIALSGYRDFSAAQKMISNNLVTEYLLKPATPMELLDAGKRALEAMGICFGDGVLAESLEEHPITRTEKLVVEAKKYIRLHFDQSLSLTKVALELGTSATYLSRIFSMQDSRGFNGYLSWYRIQKSKEFLRKDWTVSKVANSCGFTDTRSFLRVFKRVEGKTPREYREEVLLAGQ